MLRGRWRPRARGRWRGDVGLEAAAGARAGGPPGSDRSAIDVSPIVVVDVESAATAHASAADQKRPLVVRTGM